MPAVIVPVASWIAGVVSVAGAAVGITGSAGAWLAAATYTVSEIALHAGMAYAIDAATKPKIKTAGAEIQFNMDPAYPREMIIGQRLVGGSMVARYSRGSNLYNAHMVIQVADHPCVELSKVYDGGRIVQDTPLTHGVRTEITAYSISGGARVWMTWHDGRPGQTADSDLVTKSAQDPEVVAGKIPGWSNDHVGAGCAYIHVEVQWDSDILTSIPQFTWLVKGAKLYDRRLDTTAGGSGSHRLDDPSTWEYSTNAAVAADHFLLGYRVEDEELAFGIGLHPSEVPYEIFANQADLADEDVETGTGGDVETIKRYAANGVISTAEYFEEVLEAFQVQMAARFVDLGGRIGILGAEERDISLDLSDMDLVSDEQMQFADKLPFSDLYGSVGGTYADPANLYQQTPYDTLTTAYNALPDGGEAQQAQLPLPFEIHPRRAVRLASAWINRESLQPRLVGVFMAVAWALEPGDWFTFSSERLALTEAKFEVIDIAKRDDFTVTITARAIDPDFLAFDVDDDPEIGTPPEVEPFEKVLEAPAFTPTATTISGGGATEPVIQVVTTAPNPVTRELVIEAQEWSGSALTGPVLFFTGHADDLTTILRQGLKPATAYKVRMKGRSGDRESQWSDWSSAITMSSSYIVPLAGGASGDLSDLLDDIDSEIAAADARLDAAEDELDLQGTAIGELETVTDGHATSISGLQAKTTINANLLPNSTGAGGLEGWTNPGAWLTDDHPLWGRWFSRLFTGASSFTEYFFNTDAIDVNPSTQYTVSFSPFLSGLDGGSVTFYVVYYNSGGSYVGEGGNLVLTADSTTGARNSATFTTGATTAKVRFAVAMVNAVGDATYAHVGFWQAKIERGATATVWSDDGTLQEARARITTVETVASDNETAIATLDSRLDAAETDIDGVQSTASNLSTRMTAVDGGAALSQTQTALKAELVAKTNPGQNLMPYPSGLGDDALASTIGWNVFSAPTPTQALYMPFYAPAGGAFYYSYWSSGYNSAGYAYIVYEFPDGAVPGQTYTLSLKGDTNLTAPIFYLGARNASHADIGASSAGALSSTRNSVTLVAPANTAYLTLIIELPPQDSSGAYREISFRDIKLEVGSAATVFTDDYAAGNTRASVSVIQSALAAPDGSTALIAMEADADGVVTGFKIISSNGHSTPISLIEFTAALASFTGDVIVAGSITTDRIETDGITEFDVVSTSASVTFDGSNSSTWVSLFTAASVVVPADTKVEFDFSFIISWASTSGAGEIQMRLRRDSTTIESWSDISTLDVDAPGERRTTSFSSSEVDTPGAGTYTYTLQVMLDELGSADPLCYLREGKAKIKQFYR